MRYKQLKPSRPCQNYSTHVASLYLLPGLPEMVKQVLQRAMVRVVPAGLVPPAAAGRERCPRAGGEFLREGRGDCSELLGAARSLAVSETRPQGGICGPPERQQ